MNLEQLIQLLNQDEQTEFETLVSESQAGGDSKAIRGRLARLAIGVLKGAIACHSGMASFAEAGVSDG